MARIVVDPERLRQLSAGFSRESHNISEVDRRVQSAVGQLQWEVRQKANIEGALQNVRNQGHGLGNHALDLARFLDRKADDFANADNQGIRSLGHLSDETRSLLALMMPIDIVSRFVGKNLTWKRLLESAVIGVGSVGTVGSLIGIEELLKRYLGYGPNEMFAADPVNTAVGNFFHETTDTSIGGLGPSLMIRRFYNSVDPTDGPFGYGWLFNYGLRLDLSEDREVAQLTSETGRRILFVKTEGVYAITVGVNWELEEETDGTMSLKDGDRSKYVFSKSGNLTSISDRNGNRLRIILDDRSVPRRIEAASGRQLDIKCDESGRIVSIVDPVSRELNYEYDDFGNLICFEDAGGAKITYVYDEQHRLISIVDANSHAVVDNIYFCGRVVSQKDALGNRTSYRYFSNGETNLTEIEDALGRKTVHTYDQYFRIVADEDPNGNSKTYEYDEHHNLTKVTNRNDAAYSYEFDDLDNLVAATSPNGGRSTFGYDTERNLVSVTNPLGIETTYYYDNKGNLIEISPLEGVLLQFKYSDRGQITDIIDPLRNRVGFEYSDEGDLAQRIDQAGQKIIFRRDRVGRLTSVEDSQSNKTTIEYDPCNRVLDYTNAEGHTRRYSYDPVGNQLTATDPLGNITKYVYSDRDEMVKVIDALGGCVEMEYDEVGNQVAMVDANDNKAYSVYDNLDQQVAFIDQMGLRYTYSYDPEGLLTLIRDPNGSSVEYHYDSMLQIHRIQRSDGSTVSFEYDLAGRLVGLRDDTGEMDFTYDELNNLLSIKYPDKRQIKYSYDKNGNRIAIKLPGGKNIEYKINAVGRPLAVAGPLGLSVEYTYNQLGRPLTVSRSNGVASEYEYDDVGRVTGLRTMDSSSEIIFSLSYEYDAAGNRICSVEAGVKTEYAYDALGRLISIHSEEQELRYEYDAMGNRTRSIDGNGETTIYEYDPDNRLARMNDTTMEYDNNGNVVRIDNGQATRVLKYDTEDRVVSISDDTIDVSFQYNALGLRLGKQTADKETRYLCDINSSVPLVLEEDLDGCKTTYVYGLGTRPESATSDGTASTYLPDGHGSIKAVADTDGEIIKILDYLPFGERTAEDQGDIPFGFSGEQFDSETGYVFLRARYYDPAIGRFINKDPGSGDPYQTQTVNQYVYVGNNPIGRIDPSGLYWGEDFLADWGDHMLKFGNDTKECFAPGWWSERSGPNGWGQYFWPAVVDKGTWDQVTDIVGPLKYFPPIGVAHSFVGSLMKDCHMATGQIGWKEFAWGQAEDLIGIYSGKTKFAWPPGRPPNLFSLKFFTGSRAQYLVRWWGQEALKGIAQDRGLAVLRKYVLGRK